MSFLTKKFGAKYFEDQNIISFEIHFSRCKKKYRKIESLKKKLRNIFFLKRLFRKFLNRSNFSIEVMLFIRKKNISKIKKYIYTHQILFACVAQKTRTIVTTQRLLFRSSLQTTNRKNFALNTSSTML